MRNHWPAHPRAIPALLATLMLAAPAAQAQTVTISGKVVTETGQPLERVLVSANDPTIGRFNEFFTGTRTDGTFQFSVPPAV